MLDKAIELWGKLPAWIRWPLIIIVAPNLIILSILFFTLFVPWHYATIDATILTYKEKRDLQIENMIQTQKLQYESLNTSLTRIEEHQKIMYKALLSDRHRSEN